MVGGPLDVLASKQPPMTREGVPDPIEVQSESTNTDIEQE
jgi:hypothetical protein